MGNHGPKSERERAVERGDLEASSSCLGKKISENEKNVVSDRGEPFSLFRELFFQSSFAESQQIFIWENFEEKNVFFWL